MVEDAAAAEAEVRRTDQPFLEVGQAAAVDEEELAVDVQHV